MKYIVCQEPGVWKKRKRSIPKIEDNEALIAIKKIGVCGTDLHAFKGNQAFFNYPRILGHELAGIIQKLPSNKKSRFKEGDQVAILPYINCNECSACLSRKTNCCTHLKVLGIHIDGGMQEQIAVPQSHLIAKKGTPTMGGIIILLSITISVLMWSNFNTDVMLPILFIMLSFINIQIS